MLQLLLSEVYFLPCVIGFELISDKCTCSDFIISSGIVCDTVYGAVKREGKKWVSVYGIDGVLSVPAHTSACPLNYCKEIEVVSLIWPGELCNGGRIGILSGHCPSGQRVVFGSPECQLCSNMWRMTILMYAVFEAFFTGCCVVHAEYDCNARYPL